MDKRLLACGLGGLVVMLTACGTSALTSEPVVERTVFQQCVATYPDGTIEVIDDDYCEDHDQWFYRGVYYPTTLHYGGAVYYSNGHRYVRGGRAQRPVNTIVVVRSVTDGGSPRTQGAVRSYNDHVRRTLGTTPTLKAVASSQRNGQGSGVAARSSDDRRERVASSTVGKASTPSKPVVSVRTGRR